MIDGSKEWKKKQRQEQEAGTALIPGDYLSRRAVQELGGKKVDRLSVRQAHTILESEKEAIKEARINLCGVTMADNTKDSIKELDGFKYGGEKGGDGRFWHQYTKRTRAIEEYV